MAKTIDLQIEQPTVRRGHAVTRRRGQIVEMEVDASVIVAAYNNLYEKFHNEALQSILVRYPGEELTVLQEIEEALCTPGAIATDSPFLNVTRTTSRMASPETSLATRSRLCTTWRPSPAWTLPSCRSKVSPLSMGPTMR